MNDEKNKQTVHNVRLRSVVLPTEHGGWGFVGEPIVLGLLVAASWSGFLLALAAFAAFLTRQPLKIALKDYRNQRQTARTQIATRFAAAYLIVMLVAFGLTLLLAKNLLFLIPIGIATPFALIQMTYDAQNKSRNPIAEITGAIAISVTVAAMTMLAGWQLIPALGIWFIISVKAVTSIAYVRSRLRLERDKPAQITQTHLLHIMGLIILGVGAALNWIPWLAVAGFLFLTGRALLGLSHYRKPRPPAAIGIREVLFGVGFMLVVAAGYWFTL